MIKKSSEPFISVIIVNLNTKNCLANCLFSLRKIDYSHFETILVDNGSDDRSVEFVQKNFPEIRLIRNQENLGFARANNQGFQRAKGDYLLFLNSDTQVEPDFLKKLVKAMRKKKKIGVGQPKIVFEDSGKLQAGGTFLTSTGFLYHFGYGKDPNEPKYNQEMEIFSANGACMLVKREVIERVGLFDPDFFCYFEESDFCWRAWLAGYKICYFPSALIHHQGAATTRSLNLSFIYFHSFKNRICSQLKNLGTRELFKVLPPHLFFCQLTAFFYFLTRRPKLFLIIQKAIFWNMVNFRKTWQKRKKIQQRVRLLHDNQFFIKIKKKVKFAYYYYLLMGQVEQYDDKD